MRYLIFFFLLISNHFCFAQSEKLNLSFVINSIFSSKDCFYLLTNDEKTYLFTDTDKKNQEIINFDCYNSHGIEVVYTIDKKNILKKLKKVNSACVLFITIISQNENEVNLRVDLPLTNYQLYLQSQFTVTLIDSWVDINYKLNNGTWVLTKMVCGGF